MSAEELSQPLGPLPPMKIHCGQMVEGALRAALEAEGKEPRAESPESKPSNDQSGTLADALNLAGKTQGKIKIVLTS
jgi:nitrogen fixation NifU-like protein